MSQRDKVISSDFWVDIPYHDWVCVACESCGLFSQATPGRGGQIDVACEECGAAIVGRLVPWVTPRMEHDSRVFRTLDPLDGPGNTAGT